MLIVFVIVGLKARGAVFVLKGPGNPASFFRKNEDGPAGQTRGDDERVKTVCFIVPFFADLVVIARSLYPIPSRTRPSKSSAPMVLSLKAWKSRSLPGLPRTEDPLFTISQNKSPAVSRGAFCLAPAAEFLGHLPGSSHRTAWAAAAVFRRAGCGGFRAKAFWRSGGGRDRLRSRFSLARETDE